MKFDKYIPTQTLRPYIKYFVVSENDVESQYKVFPTSGIVIGFQYSGQLHLIKGNHANKLDSAGITGISDTFKVFKNSSGIGTVLIYFTEVGFASFTSDGAHELFNESTSLENIFSRAAINEVEEKLFFAISDRERIHILERFLLSQLKYYKADNLINEAVRLIHLSKGTVRIKELNEKLCISQSPLEKRFRKIVGTTPKKFASIVRFNTALNHLNTSGLAAKDFYSDNYFDQSHFIKDFKNFTGQTPENFKRFL